MGRKGKRTSGVGKGASSGVIISIAIHVGAFLLAGALVVFTVVNKEEKQFEPPKPVERPKMKLKKPKVKVKKNAKPKSTNRIVTKVNKATMPDIQLPEMSGMGDGLAGGMGEGFGIELDLDEITLLGSSQSIGSDLEGTYYDLKLSRDGRFVSDDVYNFRYEIIRFVKSGFKPSSISKFYRSPNKIYATCIMIPPTISAIAPAAFGDRDAAGAQWMVHYSGNLVHSEDITFRFWAAADETLLVKVDGEFVVGAKWANVDTAFTNVDPDTIEPFWRSSSIQSYRYIIGNSRAAVGDWITLEAGVPKDIDIVIADNGGQANFFLAVEVQGVEYPESRQGGPILPPFKTAELSHDMLDLIYKEMVPGEICLTNGPVFNDYSTTLPGPRAVDKTPEPAEVAPAPEPVNEGPRLWSWKGRQFEADFVTVIASEVVLKTPKGKTIRIRLDDLEPDDRRYVGLEQQPEFRINFTKNCEQKTFALKSYDDDPRNTRPPEKRCHYGVRLEQMSANEYKHSVKVEFFAIGQERLGQKYILLERGETTFTPTRENERSLEFISERAVTLQNYQVSDEPRGESYATHLVVITDERGEVIGISGSDWLYENVDALRELKPGNYLDKQCQRVFPTQPPRTLY